MDSICLESTVKSIECNITQKVSGEAALQELRFQKEHNIRVMVLELPTTLIDLLKQRLRRKKKDNGKESKQRKLMENGKITAGQEK